MSMRFLAVLVAAGGLMAGVAWAAPDMPNPALTPGAVASTDPSVVCVPGYARAHRHTTRSERAAVRREYGIKSRERGWVIDHRVPLELGGADTPANMWPQRRDAAVFKDDLENELHHEVCEEHSMSLRDAQKIFLGDWHSWNMRVQ